MVDCARTAVIASILSIGVSTAETQPPHAVYTPVPTAGLAQHSAMIRVGGSTAVATFKIVCQLRNAALSGVPGDYVIANQRSAVSIVGLG